jgi:hypothetical protein
LSFYNTTWFSATVNRALFRICLLLVNVATGSYRLKMDYRS